MHKAIINECGIDEKQKSRIDETPEYILVAEKMKKNEDLIFQLFQWFLDDTEEKNNQISWRTFFVDWIRGVLKKNKGANQNVLFPFLSSFSFPFPFPSSFPSFFISPFIFISLNDWLSVGGK